MALHVLTLVLNGMPWIAAQWANLLASRLDFHWHVVEGAAAPTHCTSWCQPIEPQYSKDGTREFLDSLRNSPHVTVYRKPIWDGKVTMCNTALANIKTSGILLQMDSDEIWTPAQLFQFQRLFAGNQSHAYFWCRYFFGPDIVMTTRNCYANNPKQEWKRAWRFEPGMKFTTHEPPVLDGEKPDAIMHDDTEKAGFTGATTPTPAPPAFRWRSSLSGSTRSPTTSGPIPRITIAAGASSRWWAPVAGC